MDYDFRFNLRPQYSCEDCGTYGPQILVLHNFLWADLARGAHILCPECMRVRRGEDFRLDDLQPVPANLRYVCNHWPDRVNVFLDLVEQHSLRRVQAQMESLRSFAKNAIPE